MNKPYRKGVMAIIIDKDNNILLVKKNGWRDNEWTMPGGGTEENETLEENLFRELSEEIGADKSDLNIIGLSSHNMEYDFPIELSLKIHGGKFSGQSCSQFILLFTGDKNKLIFTPLEFSNHKWVKADELSRYLVLPNQYEKHKKAIDEILPGLIN